MYPVAMPKPLVTDELWTVVEPLLPKQPPKPKGGQTQGWAPSRERSRRPYGHSVRAQDRNSLGDAPPGDGLRLRDDLLAAPYGVEQGRGVGEASPGTARPSR